MILFYHHKILMILLILFILILQLIILILNIWLNVLYLLQKILIFILLILLLWINFLGMQLNILVLEEQANPKYQYPIEFLNSLTIGGLPPHKLSLKVGSPIILLRNLNPSDSLCNGTRLICCSFQKHIIEAQIITGKYAGLHTFISRITLSPSNTTLPFTFKRQQFS